MTIESLVHALNPKTGFQGGMVLVSHDARFIDSVCNELWVCDAGKIRKFVPETAVVDSRDEDGDLKGKSGIQDYKMQIIKKIEAK
jgi:ATPase subunit of ABC transporter with duplicated ATPase domains